MNGDPEGPPERHLPSDDFWDRALPPKKRQAAAVGHSLTMVAALPEERASADSVVAQFACLEAWFVHMRLLAEFFGISGRGSNKDFSCESFGWDRAEDEMLNDIWAVASRHVVHFSVQRTPERVRELEPFDESLSNLRMLTWRMFGIAEAFVEHLESTDDEQAVDLRFHLEEAKGWNTVNPGPPPDCDASVWFEYSKWLFERQAHRFESLGTQAIALLGLLGILLALLAQLGDWTWSSDAAAGLLVLAALLAAAALVPRQVGALNVAEIEARFSRVYDGEQLSMLPLETARLLRPDDHGHPTPIASITLKADQRGGLLRLAVISTALALVFVGLYIAQLAMKG